MEKTLALHYGIVKRKVVPTYQPSTVTSKPFTYELFNQAHSNQKNWRWPVSFRSSK